MQKKNGKEINDANALGPPCANTWATTPMSRVSGALRPTILLAPVRHTVDTLFHLNLRKKKVMNPFFLLFFSTRKLCLPNDKSTVGGANKEASFWPVQPT